MDAAQFATELGRDGYRDVETKELAGGYRAEDHAHGYDVRALVLAGEITLTWRETVRSFTAGEVFTMDAGTAHAEAVGPEGVRYLVGRRAR